MKRALTIILLISMILLLSFITSKSYINEEVRQSYSITVAEHEKPDSNQPTGG